MTTAIQVSVIIPHLNQEDALAKCIASLEGQSFDPAGLEVIIVDNGSCAMPGVGSDKFAAFQILQELEPGPGPARNTGVAASSGEFLFFIDADCLAHQDWVKNGMTILKDGDDSGHDRPLLGGDVRIALGSPDQMTALEAYETMFAYRQEAYIKQHGFSGAGNLAIWREAFDIVGPFPGIEVAEDRGWGRAAIQKGLNFRWAPSQIIYHPARESFTEIFDKWNRHTRHDLEEMIQEGRWRLKWLVRIVLVLASIPVHALKILVSNRLERFSWKIKAVWALTRVRLFRVGLMTRLFASKSARDEGVSWNRD